MRHRPLNNAFPAGTARANVNPGAYQALARRAGIMSQCVHRRPASAELWFDWLRVLLIFHMFTHVGKPFDPRDLQVLKPKITHTILNTTSISKLETMCTKMITTTNWTCGDQTHSFYIVDCGQGCTTAKDSHAGSVRATTKCGRADCRNPWWPKRTCRYSSSIFTSY